jgi:hypothetical protein
MTWPFRRPDLYMERGAFLATARRLGRFGGGPLELSEYSTATDDSPAIVVQDGN